MLRADVMMTSNFELKPLKLSVFDATDSIGLRSASAAPSEPAQSGNVQKRTSRPIENCTRTSLKADSTNAPIEISKIEIELSDEEKERLSNRLPL